MTTGRHRTTDGEPESESQGTDTYDTGVSAHSTSPERTVFTERDNNDGWIATDLTVELRP